MVVSKGALVVMPPASNVYVLFPLVLQRNVRTRSHPQLDVFQLRYRVWNSMKAKRKANEPLGLVLQLYNETFK